MWEYFWNYSPSFESESTLQPPENQSQFQSPPNPIPAFLPDSPNTTFPTIYPPNLSNPSPSGFTPNLSSPNPSNPHAILSQDTVVPTQSNPPILSPTFPNLDQNNSDHLSLNAAGPHIVVSTSPDSSSPAPPNFMPHPTPINLDMQTAGGEKVQPFPLHFSRKKFSKRKNKVPDNNQTHQDSDSNPVSEIYVEGEKPLETRNAESELDTPIAKRKGVRSCTQHPISKFVTYAHLSKPVQALVTNLSSEELPTSIQEAWANPNWKHAIMEEMRALEKNGTWEVVPKPKDKVPVGCRWVFTIKYKADGEIERYKARLVAKGYAQTYGIDYQETFAPVAKMNTVRVLLSLAANQDWPLQQLDVKNAFLNGDLKEEVYMELPPGFENRNMEGQVCKLRKSLYGLKQAPRAWFDKFTKALRQQEYVQAHSDHTLFFRHRNGKITILIVYVDDIILTGDDSEEIERLKRNLALEFEMKDLGKLRYFLGMEVARNKTGISVSQRKYVIDLLQETGMLGCKPVDTPMDPNVKLELNGNGTPVDKGRYQRLVGKLIYLSHTRPDIAFSVSCVSQFMHSPSEEHMDAVYRILRYLKGIPGKGLFFKKNENRGIEVFTDADWAGSINDRRSTSGYCSFVWGNLVTWRSKKQTVVARSSAEAELRSAAHGVCEALWLKMLLEELKVSVTAPLKIFCDNKAAINISHNPLHHDRTKHIEVDRHFIKEKIEEGTICVVYVPTSEQTADILTKGLFRPTFEKLVDKLGMYNLYNSA